MVGKQKEAFLFEPLHVQRQFLSQYLCESYWCKAVVLRLVGSIEPNRCLASIHRTLNYNQERIQKILEGDAVLN